MTGSRWVAAADGTRKRHVQTASGTVETAVFLVAHADTACISTQAGCNIGCQFCLTGQARSSGNLSADEIWGQIADVQQFRRPTYRMGVTFQGMGEPLLNLDATLEAVERARADSFADYFMMSTIGPIRGLQRLHAAAPTMRLQISLHASNDDLRRRLIPGSGGASVVRILEEGARQFETSGWQVLLNYVMLAGVNDQDAHADELVSLLTPVRSAFRVKLSKFNPHDRLPFDASEPKRHRVFRERLEDAGIVALDFASMGTAIGAGCGHFNPLLRQGGAATCRSFA
ncbi:MAG: radical SAM protein [Candidatus Phosphoribacter sp.]